MSVYLADDSKTVTKIDGTKNLKELRGFEKRRNPEQATFRLGEVSF